MIKAKGMKLFDGEKEVKLRGYSVGNWLMMENFMMGFPGVEQQFRYYLKEFAGEEKSSFFFRKLMDYYFAEEDIRYLKNLGINVIRLPFNYRHFEEDEHPFVYKEDGFYYMDRTVQLCKKYGIYLILDLHGAQGYQSEDWHCDNYERVSHLYDEPMYQKRVISLWKHIAAHYKDEETIAAYDLLNEPAARGERRVRVLDQLYKDIVSAIREVDQEHMIVIRGNYWGQNFVGFSAPFDDNLLYSCHHYEDAETRQVAYPILEGVIYDKRSVEFGLKKRDQFIRDHQVPCWIGEFGILDDNPLYSQSKLNVLTDHLEILNEQDYNWTLWSYKDIGFVGLVRPGRETPWVKLTRDVIRLKKKYNCDYNTILSERWLLSSIIKQYVGDDLGDYYEETRDQWENELAKVFNLALVKLFCKKMAAFSLDELDELAASFKFSNCVVKEDWEKIIRPALNTENVFCEA